MSLRLKLVGPIVVLLGLRICQGATSVAVVGVGPDSQPVAHALENAIAAESSVKVVHALTAAQALGQPTSQPSATEPSPPQNLDAPELLVVLRHSLTRPAMWRLRICNVQWGTCLVDRQWQTDGGAAPDVMTMQPLLDQALIQPVPPKARTVILLPIESADFSQKQEKDCDAVQIALEQELQSRGMALLDFDDAALLAQQRIAAGMPPLSIPNPLIFSGKLKHVGSGNDVVMTLQLDYEGKKIGEFPSKAMSLDRCAEHVDTCIDPLIDAAPHEGGPLAAADIQKNLRSIAKSLSDAGRIDDALNTLEAALLLDPSNAPLQGDCARLHGKVIAARLGLMRKAIPANLTWDQQDAAENQIRLDNEDDATWGLLHIRTYCAGCNVSITRNNWEDMPMQITTAAAPLAHVRSMILDVLRAKQRNHVKDEFTRYIVYFVQQHGNRDRNDEEELAFLEQLGDAWAPGKRNDPMDLYVWSVLVNPNMSSSKTPKPAAVKLIAYLEQSSNPDAHPVAAKLRDAWTQAANPRAVAKAPASAPVPIDPVAKFVEITLPGRPQSWSCGFVSAGPKADVFYTGKAEGASVYYMREDATGGMIGEMVGDGSPAFDGRYIWFVGKADEQTVINAYDTTTDRLLTTSKEQDFPRDLPQRTAIATNGPGHACLAVQFGTQSNRTWVALLNMDPANGIQCKVVLTCSKKMAAAKNHPAPVDDAFEIDGVYCLPGPPGEKEQATPQFYVVRRSLRGALRINPADESCVVEDRPGVQPQRGSWLVDQEKAYQNGQIWNPRSDEVIKCPPRPPAYGALLVNGNVYSCFDANIRRGTLGGKLEPLAVEFPKEMRHIAITYSISSLFGLITEEGHHMVPVDKRPANLPQGCIADADVWIVKYAGNAKDVDLFETLAIRAARRGDEDGWAAQLAQAVKYDKPGQSLRWALDHATEQVRLANYYLHRDDYMTADKYATDAASVNSEWSLDACADAAEALGQWDRSEQYSRDLATAYGPWLWYCWCARTGHGDVKAARDRVLAELDSNAAKGQQDTGQAFKRGFVMQIDGDVVAARPLLLHAASDGPLAGLELAMQAADAGNIAERDRLLELAAQAPEDDVPVPNRFVPIIQDYFKTDGKVDLKRLKQVQNYVGTGWSETELYYALGRASLSRHDQPLAIKYLQHAAALPQNCMARTLAGIYLRKLGEPLPKPGEWKD